MTPMRVHLVQFDIAWEDKRANHARVLDLVERAEPAPGDFVLLPEMFDTGFSLHVARTVDDDGASATFVGELARRFQVTVQGARTVHGPDPATGKARNRALVVDPTGDTIAVYDKLHPFSYGREPERFEGGTELTTFHWQGLAICPAICYDLRFPELFRAGLDLGADAYALGANWPAERAGHWRTLAIARAIENQAFVFAVNRVGSDPHLAYAGGSIAVAPDGAILAEADDTEQVLAADVDPAILADWRSRFPAWKDRSPALRSTDRAGWAASRESG